ncbi:MAG: hypothetical protein ACI9AU_000285 [Bacteroidia bacterium]|jgi:hypothetical protein
MRFIHSIVFIFCTLLSIGQLNSATYRVGLQVGAGMANRSIQALNNESYIVQSPEKYNVISKSTPVLSLTADFRFNDKFTFGLLASRQSLNGEFADYKYMYENTSTLKSEDVNFKLKRRFIGAVTKYHWRISMDELELYSALRVGYIQWQRTIETTDPNFIALDKITAGRPAIGLVPIGAKFYFLDGFGLSSELAISSPYILNIGAVYKW